MSLAIQFGFLLLDGDRCNQYSVNDPAVVLQRLLSDITETLKQNSVHAAIGSHHLVSGSTAQLQYFVLQARTSSVLVLLLYQKHLFRSTCSAKKVFVFCEFFLKDFIRKYECGRTASTANEYPLALLLALLGRIASTAGVRTLCHFRLLSLVE